MALASPQPYSVAAALDAMRRRRAVVIGDVVLDIYLFGETQRVSREAPVLVVREERRDCRLGAAANTAANLAALGLEVELVALVGHDERGQVVRQLLREAGCGASGLVDSSRPTVSKTRILAGAFGTARQQVLRLDQEPPNDFTAAQHDAAAARLIELGARAEVVIVSDYGHGTVCGPVMRALEVLRARKVPVCVDSRYRLRDFVGMTALTPNIPEAEGALGFELQDNSAVVRGGHRLLEELQCEACLITQGRGGMTLFTPAQPPEHIGVVGPAEVTDVTGAGDSVIATLGAALAAGLGLKNGMRLATCAAGVVVNRVGCASASPADVSAAAAAGKVMLEPWDSAAAP